jgi:hypothetical protein
MNNLNPSFPLRGIERASQKLNAIAQYHQAGVGYAREHERLLKVTIAEVQSFLGELKQVAAQWDLECPEPHKPSELAQDHRS